MALWIAVCTTSPEVDRTVLRFYQECLVVAPRGIPSISRTCCRATMCVWRWESSDGSPIVEVVRHPRACRSTAKKLLAQGPESGPADPQHCPPAEIACLGLALTCQMPYSDGRFGPENLSKSLCLHDGVSTLTRCI